MRSFYNVFHGRHRCYWEFLDKKSQYYFTWLEIQTRNIIPSTQLDDDRLNFLFLHKSLTSPINITHINFTVFYSLFKVNLTSDYKFNNYFYWQPIGRYMHIKKFFFVFKFQGSLVTQGRSMFQCDWFEVKVAIFCFSVDYVCWINKLENIHKLVFWL